MKKLIALLPIVLIVHFATAQNQPGTDARADNAAYCKSIEPQVVMEANYLFTTPFQKDDSKRLNALAYIVKWMSDTPDYSFGLEESILKHLKGNDDLLGLYMAAMAKYCLENPANAKDMTLVKVNAFTTILNYCEDPKNNVKLTKGLKKLSEAKAKGELEKVL